MDDIYSSVLFGRNRRMGLDILAACTLRRFDDFQYARTLSMDAISAVMAVHISLLLAFQFPD